MKIQITIRSDKIRFGTYETCILRFKKLTFDVHDGYSNFNFLERIVRRFSKNSLLKNYYFDTNFVDGFIYNNEKMLQKKYFDGEITELEFLEKLHGDSGKYTRYVLKIRDDIRKGLV